MRSGHRGGKSCSPPLLAALPLALLERPASAGKIDPSETVVTPADAIKWTSWSGLPPHSGEMAPLYGSLDQPGPYLLLMKWNPGYRARRTLMRRTGSHSSSPAPGG
jgi:hypothetical protein